jgi:HEAT repeat protein/energy-coupling factor transporter ATP-binding protein EcfA2
LSDGKKKDLDQFVVLTSNKILEEAKDSVWASLRGARLDKLVKFIDGDHLVALLEKHLPSAFWEEYDYFTKYFNALKADFARIKDISAIGRQEPVPLENIYVSLKLTETVKERVIPVDKDRKIIEEELIKKELERPAERARVLDAERAITDYNKLVIVGAPGSGKTTLLKHLALKSCTENIKVLERTCVPIPITLRELSDSGKDIRQYIDAVFEIYDFPKAKEFVENDLKTGKCQLLLDGFDELATKEQQEQIAVLIHRFIVKYHKCQIVVTSRIAGYHDELSGFTKLELMEFDDKQIEKFIQNWFGASDPAKAKSMQAAIKANEQLKALARNPLMIAIIAIIYEEDRELPQRRADLYERCVEVLLSKWDVQKRLKNKYPTEKKEFILRKLAFYAHSNNKRAMTEKEVMQVMLLYLPQIRLKKGDAKPLLDEIWQRSYLLRQISMDSYDFLHLSFQEYFTAFELKEQEEGISSIIQHLEEPWWEEPILLYAGMSKDATALIKRIQNEVPEDIFYSNLMLFGKCMPDAEFTVPSLRDTIINELWSLYKTAEFAPLREKAIGVLALIKPDSIIDSLINDLAAKESDVRRSAAYALGVLGSEKAVDPLITTLSTDKESDVRGRAADALGGIRSEKAVEPLVTALTTAKESDVRGRAADALGGIGSEKAVEPLITILTTAKESDVRVSAASALGGIGSEKAVEPLITILTTAKESDVRASAASALGGIGSEKAVEPLVTALTTAKESDVRVSAASALGKIGSEKAVEPLINTLTTAKESFVRLSATFALVGIGSEKAVDPLITALSTTKESDVRLRAAFALGGIRSEKAVDPLITALSTTKESDVRWRAASALGGIGSEKAVEPLITALSSDKDSYVRGGAVDALGGIGSEKAVEPLITALSSAKESFVRGRVADALGGIGSEKAVEPLITALSSDKDSYVRGRAADALGEIGSEKAVEPLKSALKDESAWMGEKVKDGAFTALEKISRRIHKRILREPQ